MQNRVTRARLVVFFESEEEIDGPRQVGGEPTGPESSFEVQQSQEA